MKARIRIANEEQIKAQYPISGLVTGWFFKQEEFSPGGWRVIGTDLFGRIVSREGSDPKTLLHACIKDAEAIQSEIQKVKRHNESFHADRFAACELVVRHPLHCLAAVRGHAARYRTGLTEHGDRAPAALPRPRPCFREFSGRSADRFSRIFLYHLPRTIRKSNTPFSILE